ncbi:MAG: type I restriction endonuclease subunit R, partial [Cellulomonadaceae bacterium]|nr:type I restriction endonuclease subunit R [Cellulomonadaceae bacterium]
MTLSEWDWERRMLEELSGVGWKYVHGSAVAPGVEGGRGSWDDIILPARMLAALKRLNPEVPQEYLAQALAEVTAPKSRDAMAENFRTHQILVGGYRGITYLDAAGIEHNPTIRFVGHHPQDNEFLAVNQVTVRSLERERRYDVVLYLNGLPIGIVELKKAGDEHADLAKAHAQLDAYLAEFPLTFRFSALTVISDGILAKYGTPFTPLNHYSPWNVDDDGVPYRPDPNVWAPQRFELDDIVGGVLRPDRLLIMLRDFIAFDADADGLAKRIAKPHQYVAVTKAVRATIDAVKADGRIGVVWHTQGSGKSMEMELYTHAIGQVPQLTNPTVIVVTDRTDLDSQLFQTFARSQLLAETPVNVTSRRELREELSRRVTGGIYFSTLQKFGLTEEERRSGLDHPLLSQRRNIIVIVDEAHRSHYDNLDGYARHIRDALPHAAFIAFTGTPIAIADRDTRAVFGDTIDTYDLTRAVEDGATVPVYYEPRIIPVSLGDAVTDTDLDTAADEAALGLDSDERQKIEAAILKLNAVYGAPDRVKKLAADIVDHWEARSAAVEPFIGEPGKAFIVCATRDICARLYAEIVALRPHWHDDANDAGIIKVVYSGSASDPDHIRAHVRPVAQTKVIQKRIKQGDDPLQIVIVKDMMLTGFDSQPLHTLYLDRPMRGAQLMQTLARVNRTYRDKSGGLLVGYAPVDRALQEAIAEYTETDREQR